MSINKSKANKKITILLISANPKGTSALNLDEEFRAIEESIRRAECRDMYKIERIGATRMHDVWRSLEELRPQIVHFSGHGTKQGIILQNESGQIENISVETLVKFIELTKNNIQCVLLNTCNSYESANAISKHIDYVIGMDSSIEDKSAIDFSMGFYDAIGFGHNYTKAYEFGKAAYGIATEDKTAPILFTRQEQSDVLKEEQSNKLPWFYHTIDHHQLPHLALENHDNLMFGIVFAKGSDAPHSFAKHCYIEMLGRKHEMDDDIDQNVHFIKLKGLNQDSFERSVISYIQPDIKPPTKDNKSAIQQWLLGHRTAVILHIRIKDEKQHYKINQIIKGAKITLSNLDFGDTRIFILFSCSNPLPKILGIFPNKQPFKPPLNCIEMGDLKHLTKDDIDEWLETEEGKIMLNKIPEKKIMDCLNRDEQYQKGLNTQGSLDYKEVLRRLQSI